MVRVFHMRHPEHTGRWATAEQLGELKQTLRGIHQAQAKLGNDTHLRVEFSHLQRWINKRLGGSGPTTAPHRPTNNLPSQPIKLTHSEIMSKVWNHPILGPEMKKLQSTFMLNWWADPQLGIERKERMRQFKLAWWNDPVYGMKRSQEMSEWNNKWYNDPVLGPIRRKEVSDRESAKWQGEAGMKRRADASERMTARYSGEHGQDLRDKKRKENDAHFKDEVHGKERMEQRNASAAANKPVEINVELFKQGGTWTEATHLRFDQIWFQGGKGRCPDMHTFPESELLFFLPKAFQFLFPGTALPPTFPVPEATDIRPHAKRTKRPWRYEAAFSWTKDSMPDGFADRILLDDDPFGHHFRYLNYRKGTTCNKLATGRHGSKAGHNDGKISGALFYSWVGMYKFSEELLKHAKAQDIPGTANIVVTSLTSHWTKA